MEQIKREEELIKNFLENNKLFLAPEEDIITDHGLAPITKREIEAIKKIKDSTLSVVRSKLQAGATESLEMLEQVGAAPGAKWGDLITGVYTASGDLSIAASGGLLGFANNTQYVVKHTIKFWMNDPTVGINEGDAFIHNDARYGGIHGADQSLLLPIFHQGELVAWAVAIIHEGENGAVEPGGIPSAAESKYMEGLTMPPFKIAENYQLKRDLVTFLQASVRDPKLQIQDMKAKLAACIRLKQRVDEAIEEYGLEPVIATLRKTLDDTVIEARRRFSQWPDGTVRAFTVSDSTLRENILIKNAVTITKKGEDLHIDFSGSSPEFGNRSINTQISALKGALSGLFLSFIWPDLPRNQAVIVPMKITIPEKSVYNPSYETPSAQSMMTIFPIYSALQLALAKFLYSSPEKSTKIVAPWYNMISTFSFGGVSQNGDIVGNIGADLNGMPGGARSDMDGEHSIAPLFAAMADLGEQELIEEELPMIQLSRRLMKDNQGFGKFRGGSGHQMIVAVKDTPFFGLMSTVVGSKYPSMSGLFGGYACPAYPLAKVKGIDVFKILKETPEKFNYSVEEIMNNRPFENATYTTHQRGLIFELVQQGELYMMVQGAGGGYGDILDRDPESVLNDLEDGLISDFVAQNIYKVVYDSETYTIDEESTREARQLEREARKKRGIPFNQFIKQWVKDAPPENLPWYGSWGDENTIFAGSPQVKFPAENYQTVFIPDPKDVRLAQLEAHIEQLPPKS